MTVFNLGSINIDNFYYLSHLPTPGETQVADRYARALGGKGANQSVAACRAGAETVHIGAVGNDGDWCRESLAEAGVRTRHIATSAAPTGRANVYIDQSGENQIVLLPGANRELEWDLVEAALKEVKVDDWLLLQNETTFGARAARFAQAKGAKVVYSAAPFDLADVKEVLPHCDLLVMNEVEAKQLIDALSVSISDLSVPAVLTTMGKNGALWHDRATGETHSAPAFPVTPVDTTGAGDCFIGNVVAAMDLGLAIPEALRNAAAAAAIQVTREGTASAMPTAQEVADFLENRD